MSTPVVSPEIDKAIRPQPKQWQADFTLGLRRGLPIALGYIPVSFTFGLVAVRGGLPAWIAIFISLTISLPPVNLPGPA